MQVANRRIYTDLEWAAYVALPGYSFSYLRNPDGVPPTPKMRFGKLVDRYLFTPEKYNGEQRELVVPVAKVLRDALGPALTHGQRQLMMTADFIHEGLTMPYRGATDLKIGKLIVDVKVSELPLVKAIQYFRYDWQVTGYAAGTGSTDAMIISIHPRTHKVSKLMVPLVYDWWEHKIKEYGLPSLRSS